MVKRNGVVVDFNQQTLERSLARSGASKDLAGTIAEEIGSTINDGESTGAIYRKAFEMLNKRARHIAMRYSLKRALFRFGPTGFPFEKFIAELFRKKGYATQTNIHLKGRCINHEVDVLAIGKERIAMEVKFHNEMHTRSDVKSILYVKARFDDLLGRTNAPLSFRKNKGVVDKCMFVTNTKFTKNALDYASCTGVTVLGWGYPPHKNLQTYIQESDLHPITCLSTVPSALMRDLFSKGVVTCKGLLEQESILHALPDVDSVISEAEMLCTPSGRQ